MTQKQWKMVEAAEAASIYNVLKCRLKVKSAQKLPLKLLKEVLASVGRYWTKPNN